MHKNVLNYLYNNGLENIMILLNEHKDMSLQALNLVLGLCLQSFEGSYNILYVAIIIERFYNIG